MDFKELGYWNENWEETGFSERPLGKQNANFCM